MSFVHLDNIPLLVSGVRRGLLPRDDGLFVVVHGVQLCREQRGDGRLVGTRETGICRTTFKLLDMGRGNKESQGKSQRRGSKASGMGLTDSPRVIRHLANSIPEGGGRR